MSKFIHLHTHSHYSLLNALPQIPDLVKRAKDNEMSALALTDSGNLYGAIEFYKKCKDFGIKPIIGVDAYVALRSRHDKQAGIDNRRSRLVILARNNEGYKNLIKMVTDSYLEGFYYKPRIDDELMEKYKSGLLAIIPSFSGETSQSLKSSDPSKAAEIVGKYKSIFGAENVYLEISHHPEIEGHADLMKKVERLGEATTTPLVAAHDVYYLDPEDRRARETLMSVQTNADFIERRDSSGTEENFSFTSGKQMESYFRSMPSAIANSFEISEKCNVELELGKWVFPNYVVESGLSYNDELRRLVYEGIKKRELQETAEITKRVEYELGVIFNKGYSPYFLVVSDLLRFAHERDILTTIRGSVAGSLVTYLAGITNVNPLEYKLPFERFLNPERPSAPDIDMDYADNRRDEVIEYAKQKYGKDRVAQIGTFGTMMARGSVRDTARALGYPYSLGDRIAKLIPMGAQGFPMTINRALDEVPDLKKIYKAEKEVKDIVDMAKKIEGCARHISVHAAGVVIAPSALTNYVPLQFDPKGEGKIITQYDMHAVDDAGLLKFDFLGIKNLSILSDSVKVTKKVYNVDVEIEHIPLNDKKTFSLLAKGETIGLFQLNGAGMTAYLKQLCPTTIFDINAMVALYRPGPMESIPLYIERKHNTERVSYLDGRLADILSQTYGVITYQDDVLLIAVNLAGYSWLEADKLRKAMGKKIPSVMEAEKEKLTNGLVKNGMTEANALELWKLIEPFAAYGFNKAHAASYGRVAYQTAYMKANFPAVYMASVLTADSGDVEKIGEIIAECKRMKIPVLAPDINGSFSGFTVVRKDGKEENMIRFGLTTIKNFGEGIANTIIAERKKNGKFGSLANFLDRIKDRSLNKKSLEALIKCGALDQLGERGIMLANIEDLLAYNKEKTNENDNQNSLFGATAPDANTLTLRQAEPASQGNKLAWEKELLGLYISGHPLDKFKDKIDKHDMPIKKIKEQMKEGMMTVVAGIIEEAKDLLTKKGDKMMFLTLADFTGNIETVIFPRVYEENKSMLQLEKCIAIKGRFSERNGRQSIIAEKIKEL